jgi:hypothetical protein
MAAEFREYRGRRIELREPEGEALVEGDAAPALLIDDEPVRYGRLPDGSYFLEDYAFDWQADLMDLAERFIDYESELGGARRGAADPEG